jgi:hypothetical protein
MTPIDELRWIVTESNRMVATLWIGQFDIPTTRGTVHEVLDAMFITAATTAAMLDGRPADAITPPFVYGWVPASELSAAFASLLAAAARADESAERLLQITAIELHGQAAALATAVNAPWTSPDALVRAG